MYFKQIPSTAIGLKSHIYTGCKIISFHHHSYTVYWTAICYNEIHHFVRHILGPLTVLWFWEIPDGMKYSLCNCHLYFYERCTIFCMQWTENTALFTLFFWQLQHVQKGLESTDVYAKKASHLALAVVVEGCSECIRTKYLELFLKCVSKGITDPAGVVRNAALFALGQFSEHLQVSSSHTSSNMRYCCTDCFCSCQIKGCYSIWLRVIYLAYYFSLSLRFNYYHQCPAL